MDYNLIKECFSELKEIKSVLKECAYSKQDDLNDYPKLSIVNLKQYLKLRSIDITYLQEKLIKLGLSSIGRSQPHILYTINQILIILSKLQNEEYNEIDNPLDYDLAYKIMNKRLKIFGFTAESQYAKTKIMVTLPSEAAFDSKLIEELATNGADILRINSAHDDTQSWRNMAESIKEINQKHNLSTKIYYDLAGPKIRTTKIKKIKPPVKIGSRAIIKKIRLIDDTKAQTREEINSFDAIIAINKEFLKKCEIGDKIEFKDLYDRKRVLEIVFIEDFNIVCEIKNSAIIDESTVLKLSKKNKKYKTNVKNIREVVEEIRVFNNEHILLKADIDEGYAKYIKDGIEQIATIGCSSIEAIHCVKVGDRVFIDDGKIELKVVEKKESEILCVVVRSKDKGVVIKEEKGINFPDSDINLKAITDEDIENLLSVIDYVDIIGISFCQSKEDIEDLISILKSKNNINLSIVAKIETQKSVKNLPSILEALIEHNNSGVMIARGDLAIEVGFENLSVLQEEILNLCEAAHMPVIYATQVLENKMKTNLPSRAEITDAAFAQRADCIMLNKGAYAVDTIKILKTILRQMHKLFKKNRQLLTIETHWCV
ncbi:MAG: hypothetical protein HXX81_03750 [Campylobacterales bacterium]|nr:hypothetical protein [Campylobacterales bacterium]